MQGKDATILKGMTVSTCPAPKVGDDFVTPITGPRYIRKPLRDGCRCK